MLNNKNHYPTQKRYKNGSNAAATSFKKNKPDNNTQNKTKTTDYNELFQNALDYRRNSKIPLDSPFRLINLAGDSVADVAVDFYSDFAAISWYSPKPLPLKDKIVDAILKLDIKVAGIYEVRRFNSSASAQTYRHLTGIEAPEFFEVEEEGEKFLCSFSHGQNAGFFIDNRENRKLIREISSGKRVLNLFAYTGALSVVAARACASDVVTVDISKSYNNWAKKNLVLNGFDKFSEKVFTFDALDYMNFCLKKDYRFDFVILDPPSFATRVNNKPFSTRKNYSDLLAAAAKIININGIILAVCNTAAMAEDEFKFIINDSLKSAGVKKFKLAKGGGLPLDFRCQAGDWQANYLKSYIIEF